MNNLALLYESLNKWIDIYLGKVPDLGTKDCPLCVEYHNEGPNTCEGCPVKIRTNSKLCRSTPYMMWLLHHAYSHDGPREIKCNVCLDICNDIIRFIEELLHWYKENE